MVEIARGKLPGSQTRLFYLHEEDIPLPLSHPPKKEGLIPSPLRPYALQLSFLISLNFRFSKIVCVCVCVCAR